MSPSTSLLKLCATATVAAANIVIMSVLLMVAVTDEHLKHSTKIGSLFLEEVQLFPQCSTAVANVH